MPGHNEAGRWQARPAPELVLVADLDAPENIDRLPDPQDCNRPRGYRHRPVQAALVKETVTRCGGSVRPPVVSAEAAERVADAVFARKVARLCARGDRAVAELLAHVARDRALGSYLDLLLDEFLEIDADALGLTGGDRLPPRPFTVIDGGRR